MSVGSLRSPGVSLLIAKGFPIPIDSRKTISGQAVLPMDHKLPAKWTGPPSTDPDF
jgi:hypothetical protein